MKKFFTTVFAAALMLVSVNGFAQWTVGGGFANTSFGGGDKDVLESGWEKTSMPGFYFGVSYEIPFTSLEGLAFEPGAYFEHYGRSFRALSANADDPSSLTSALINAASEKSYHLNYIAIPVTVKYTYELASDLSIGAYTGPKFDFGFAGNSFDKSRLGVKNFDAQWSLGYVINYSDAIQFRMGYNWGLNKDAKGVYDDLKVRRNQFQVGVGFMF